MSMRHSWSRLRRGLDRGFQRHSIQIWAGFRRASPIHGSTPYEHDSKHPLPTHKTSSVRCMMEFFCGWHLGNSHTCSSGNFLLTQSLKFNSVATLLYFQAVVFVLGERNTSFYWGGQVFQRYVESTPMFRWDSRWHHCDRRTQAKQRETTQAAVEKADHLLHSLDRCEAL